MRMPPIMGLDIEFLQHRRFGVIATWDAHVNRLSTTAQARLSRSTRGFNGGTSAGLLLNQHDGPSNSLEMVVQDSGGGGEGLPAPPDFPSHHRRYPREIL